VVYLIGLAAAVFLGIGWVLQQRIAVRPSSTKVLSPAVLWDLARNGLWWLGIAAMTLGQSLSAWALQVGSVSALEPVLAASLLVTFVISAALADERIRWQELVGPLILSATLVVFLAAGDPKANRDSDPGSTAIAIATAVAGSLTAAIALPGAFADKKSAAFLSSASLATGAGLMYGLQDAATRGAIVAAERHSWATLLGTMWPWVVLAAATTGVLLSQAAFRAGRLDYALPPTVAAQPIAGVVLGVTLLSDKLNATGWALALEALCLLGMLGGVYLIGRSPLMQSPALVADPSPDIDEQ